MAYEIPGADKISFPAGGDLRLLQYHFVRLNTSGAVVTMTADTGEYPVGILQNAPNTGETAELMLRGISKIATVAAGTVIGTLVGPDATGLGETRVINANTHNLHWVCGIATKTTVAAGDIGSILLQDPWEVMIAV
jgi:hypothetical protein